MTVSLADLSKGHEFPETRFEMTPEWVAEYLEGVDDQATGPLLDSRPPIDWPPLSLATLAIRALVDQAALPAGAIHVSQEIDFFHGLELSDVIVARARVASRGERAGWVLMGVEMNVQDETGSPMMHGRATITFPAVSKDTE